MIDVSRSRNIAFFDTRVTGYLDLIAALDPLVEVHILDTEYDGIVQPVHRVS
jgi:hypothetical protein